eukprot:128620-Chlamydomonas_euryale.AAC.1
MLLAVLTPKQGHCAWILSRLPLHPHATVSSWSLVGTEGGCWQSAGGRRRGRTDHVARRKKDQGLPKDERYRKVPTGNAGLPA